MREIRQTFSEDSFKKKPLTTQPVTGQAPSKKKSNAKLFILIPAVIIGVLFWSAMGYFYFTTIRSGIDPQIMATAAVLNKACPLMIDQETRMDNVTALPGKKMLYAYTLVNIEPGMVDTAQLKDYIQPMVVTSINTNPVMLKLKQMQATLAYHYNDKNGDYLFSFEVGPEEYNKN